MAQQASDSSISKAEQNVIFECVFEYISDIRTLMSLSLVSKRVRSAIYRSNGLRLLTLKSGLPHWLYLNGVNISDYDKDQEGKLKDGLRWIWIVGKRLKSVCLDRYSASMCICDILLPLYKSLATNEKRRIETIHIRGGIHCEMAFSLVRDNRNTLQCIELRDPFSVHLCSHLVKRLSLSGPSKSESFWSLVQQCERMKSLDLTLCDYDDPIFPLELVNVLRHTSLKHLGLKFEYLDNSKSETLQELVDLLSVENLRDDLESLELDYHISMSFLCPLVKELSSSHTPVVFVNVTVLTFDLLAVCWQSDHPMNWLSFWTVFPAVNEIKHPLWNCLPYVPYVLRDSTRLSQNVCRLCKTYLEISASRSCDIKIELPELHTDLKVAKADLAKAVTLPEDQDWCASHGVHIETETRDEKVERRVSLRKDTTTLVFYFKQC